MRPFLPAIFTLALGMVLGAWQPRGELLTARAELAALAEQPCRRSAADRVRSMLSGDRAALSPETRFGIQDAPGADAPATDDAGADDGTSPEASAEGATPTPLAPEDLEDEREMMADALAVRRSQARAALAEQADLGDDELAEVDAIMDEMNRKLKVEVDRFVEDALERGTLERRDMMEIAAVSLDTVIAADDDLAELLPDGVKIDDEARDPFSYLDAAAVERLVELQGFDDPVAR